MKTWLRQHGSALSYALSRMKANFGSFFFNALVIAIALALPIAGFTVLENVRPVSAQLAVEPEISIFLAMDTPRERALALGTDIRRIVQEHNSGGVLEFVPRENALLALKNKTGLSEALTTLGSNPLPDGYVLKLAGFGNPSVAGKAELLAARIKALPGIEYVQIDSAWVKRLAALLNVLRLALIGVALTLGMVVVAVVFNTIRLQVLTQEEEIGVSRLLGATDSYIYRPFYYSGALLGLGAGAIALCAVAFALQPLNSAIAEFARLYASEFRLIPLGAGVSALLLLGSGALGLVGAVLSVSRGLARAR